MAAPMSPASKDASPMRVQISGSMMKSGGLFCTT